jgi:hypothetical protein
MKHLVLVVVAVLALAGCKNKPCADMAPVAGSLASGLAVAMTCSNPAAMQADFLKFAADKGLCVTAEQKGVISSIVCPIAVPWIVAYGAGKLPPAWGCTGTASEAVLTMACSSVPF